MFVLFPEDRGDHVNMKIESILKKKKKLKDGRHKYQNCLASENMKTP